MTMTAARTDDPSEPVAHPLDHGRFGRFLRHHKTLHWLRYASASAVSVTVTVATLFFFAGLIGMAPGWANVIAVLIATGVSFELNRRWVWQRRGGQATAAQIIPFFALSLLGLLISTTAVHYATQWALHHHASRLERTIVAEGANLASFGTLWIAQFFILDRVLFKARHG